MGDVTTNMRPHTFVMYSTVDDTWAELDCGSCGVDMDFEQDEAPADGQEFACPSCRVTRVAKVENGGAL